MARWKLTAPHYLMTDPPTEWEHKETSRETGRQSRVIYNVPRLLNPDDPSDYNYPDEIIVCNGSNPQGRDIIFIGDPTPDMEPLDAEAKAITKKFIDSGRWQRQTEGEVFGEALIKQFMAEIAKASIGQAVAVPSIDAKAFADLQSQVKELMEQNAKLQAQVAERPSRRL